MICLLELKSNIEPDDQLLLHFVVPLYQHDVVMISQSAATSEIVKHCWALSLTCVRSTVASFPTFILAVLYLSLSSHDSGICIIWQFCVSYWIEWQLVELLFSDDLCVQTMPSSPLFAAASATERVDKSAHDTSVATDVAAPSVTTHHEHNSSQDTAVVKQPVQDLLKSSNDAGGSKQTLAAAVPSKHAASLFTDDADDDLFASPAPSKVVDFLLCIVLQHNTFFTRCLFCNGCILA